jgi:hypothetical protein
MRFWLSFMLMGAISMLCFVGSVMALIPMLFII